MNHTINYYPSKSKLFFIDSASTSNYGMYNGKPFTGIKETISDKEYIRETFVNRRLHGIKFWASENSFSIFVYIFDESRYNFDISKDRDQNFMNRIYTIYDLQTFDSIVDYKVNNIGKKEYQQGYNFTREDLDYDKKIKDNFDVIKNYEDTKEIFTRLDLFVCTYNTDNPFNLTRELNQDRAGKTLYGYLVQESMKETLGYTVEDVFMEKYILQKELAQKIISEDQIQHPIKHIAGVSVAYNDVDLKMISVIAVMDIETQEIVDQAFFELEDVTLHVPDLFAYNEVPSVLKAFEKLSIKPQLIFCDGHGIEHPKNVGLATHLGIELDIPTIGCPKKRLVGYYEKTSLGHLRGDKQELWFDDKIVGKALRTQERSNPLYISIGHKISLETAIDWVLKTTTNTRVPVVVQEAITLTEQLMPKRIRYDFLDDEENKYAIII
jgi:deoxyinosine 3'endonuclease (endonuclease V)